MVAKKLRALCIDLGVFKCPVFLTTCKKKQKQKGTGMVVSLAEDDEMGGIA